MKDTVNIKTLSKMISSSDAPTLLDVRRKSDSD